MFNLEKNKISAIIQNLNKSRILVIGDFAIDEMVYGQTARISREAPVLILRHTNTKITLGGASNAAHNISTLTNGKVSAVGVYGDDFHGPLLLSTLQNSGVDTSNMVLDSSRATTVKTRISGSSAQSVTQQIVRIDRETTDFVSKEIELKILDNIVKNAANYDAIILSDYSIGIMTPEIIDTSIKIAKKNNMFISVDTQKDLHRFKGVTVLTPNQPDAEKFIGYEIEDEQTLMKAGRDLLQKTESEMVLLTRGGDGMMLFERNGNVSGIPAFNKTDVFDVTGAGDTVVAAFTLGLCAGGGGFEAAAIGNLAASIVVRHFGCATTTKEELIHNLDRLDMEDLLIKS